MHHILTAVNGRIVLIAALASVCVAAPVRILPLGNSITFDNTSGYDKPTPRPDSIRTAWRDDLYWMLRSRGFDIQFVGHEFSGHHYFQPDTANAHNGGIPGITAPQMKHLLRTGFQQCNWRNGPKQICNGPYLDHYPADIILLHIGTNGLAVSSSVQVDSILREIDLYEARSNSRVTVVLARIINRVPVSATFTQFNDSVEALARRRIAAGDRIVIVDQERGAGIVYDSITGDMIDRLHPNDRGNVKMARVWNDALVPLLSNSPVILIRNPPDSVQVPADTVITITADVFLFEQPIEKVEFFDGWTKIGEDALPSYTCCLQFGHP